jgi:hypothetical protein
MGKVNKEIFGGFNDKERTVGGGSWKDISHMSLAQSIIKIRLEGGAESLAKSNKQKNTRIMSNALKILE